MHRASESYTGLGHTLRDWLRPPVPPLVSLRPVPTHRPRGPGVLGARGGQAGPRRPSLGHPGRGSCVSTLRPLRPGTSAPGLGWGSQSQGAEMALEPQELPCPSLRPYGALCAPKYRVPQPHPMGQGPPPQPHPTPGTLTFSPGLPFSPLGPCSGRRKCLVVYRNGASGREAFRPWAQKAESLDRSVPSTPGLRH